MSHTRMFETSLFSHYVFVHARDHRDFVVTFAQCLTCFGTMLAPINQMSDGDRPTTPLWAPNEESGIRERFTRSVEIPIIKAEPRRGKFDNGSVGRRSTSSVEPKARRRMTPTVEYAGYKETISRLQVDASEAIRTRTQDLLIERRQPVQSTPPHVEKNFLPEQHEEYGRQDESKRKYYAVRRGRIPGIYRTWDSCEKQVEGFSGCEYKSFKTEEGAQQYVDAVETHHDFDDIHSQFYETDRPTSKDVYDEPAMRNDAVHPIPNTALRRNVTQRRSQGRAKDRVSLGETSVPLETLLTRKPQPRYINVEYQAEALFTPSHPSMVRPGNESDRQVGDLPKVSPTKVQDLWNQKSKIEEDMYSALEENDEGTYRALEVKQREINSQICSILSPASSPLVPATTAMVRLVSIHVIVQYHLSHLVWMMATIINQPLMIGIMRDRIMSFTFPRRRPQFLGLYGPICQYLY